MKAPRQWDDWRCYRCQTWRRSDEPRTIVTIQNGYSVAICGDCQPAEKGEPDEGFRHRQPVG